MARGKKAAQGLTPEEKLAQALVPVEEQPYPIPENWCWTRLFGVIVSSDEKTEDFSNLELKYVGLENLEKDGGIIGYGSPEGIKSLKNVFHSGQILYGKLRPYLNKHDIATFDGICSTDILVFSTREPVLPQIVNYYFNQSKFIEYVVGNSKGINLPRVSENVILNAVFPLPPLAEQWRIVDRIESIFAKLDEAKEKAQAVVDGFELRKSAILHKAFTGELTAKWREEHKIETADWKNYKIDECCKVGSGGTPSRKHPEYYDGSIPWIKTGEIDWNDILDAEEKISDAAVQDSSAKIYEPGVVLVAMYGMGVTRGKAAILRVQAATNQAVCVLQPKNDLLNRYLFYYFMYNYWNIREKSVGGNQLNLSATIIKNFDILIPSIDEQFEIIRILDGLLAKEKAAKEAAESVLDQIDTMKKAVLARAFRGELGTNDPTEASAVELLKSML